MCQGPFNASTFNPIVQRRQHNLPRFHPVIHPLFAFASLLSSPPRIISLLLHMPSQNRVSSVKAAKMQHHVEHAGLQIVVLPGQAVCSNGIANSWFILHKRKPHQPLCHIMMVSSFPFASACPSLFVQGKGLFPQSWFNHVQRGPNGPRDLWRIAS